MTRTDLYSEIYLWNECVDRMVRVLQRLELHSIRSQRGLRAYAIRLEEIRAGLNADFAEVMAARERADEFRFWSWQSLWKDKRRGRTELVLATANTVSFKRTFPFLETDSFTDTAETSISIGFLACRLCRAYKRARDG